MFQRCLNIDWLEVYCLADESHGFKDASFFEQEGFTVLMRDYGTRVYKEMFTLFTANGKPFLEIRRNPASLVGEHGGVMRPESCHIRLCNYACYVDNPVARLRDFLAKYNYILVSIYRLDICLDFERFDSGDIPDRFVQRYMEGKYSKMNQSNVSAYGTDTWERRAWNSLSWGARKSMIGTKLYCKSLELEQASDKPYIKYTWFKYGMVDDPQTLVKMGEDGKVYKPSIWRLEFSIRSTAKKWFVIERSDTKRRAKLYQPHVLTMYDTQEKLLAVFDALAYHYFHFKYYEDGKRKDRCKDKELFHFSPQDTFLTIKANVSDKSPRTFKERLLNLLQAYRLSTANPELINASETLINALRSSSFSAFLGDSFTPEEVKAMQLLVSTRLGQELKVFSGSSFSQVVEMVRDLEGELF